MRPITKQDFDNMTLKEREELQRQAVSALIVRFMFIFLLKLALQILLRRWLRKLGES